jgi:hypothetical protein
MQLVFENDKVVIKGVDAQGRRFEENRQGDRVFVPTPTSTITTTPPTFGIGTGPNLPGLPGGLVGSGNNGEAPLPGLIPGTDFTNIFGPPGFVVQPVAAPASAPELPAQTPDPLTTRAQDFIN